MIPRGAFGDFVPDHGPDSVGGAEGVDEVEEQSGFPGAFRLRDGESLVPEADRGVLRLGDKGRVEDMPVVRIEPERRAGAVPFRRDDRGGGSVRESADGVPVGFDLAQPFVGEGLSRGAEDDRAPVRDPRREEPVFVVPGPEHGPAVVPEGFEQLVRLSRQRVQLLLRHPGPVGDAVHRQKIAGGLFWLFRDGIGGDLIVHAGLLEKIRQAAPDRRGLRSRHGQIPPEGARFVHAPDQPGVIDERDGDPVALGDRVPVRNGGEDLLRGGRVTGSLCEIRHDLRHLTAGERRVGGLRVHADGQAGEERRRRIGRIPRFPRRGFRDFPVRQRPEQHGVELRLRHGAVRIEAAAAHAVDRSGLLGPADVRVCPVVGGHVGKVRADGGRQRRRERENQRRKEDGQREKPRREGSDSFHMLLRKKKGAAERAEWAGKKRLPVQCAVDLLRGKSGRGTGLFAEVAIEQALEGSAVTGFVLRHFVNGVVDGVEVGGLGLLRQIELAGAGSVFGGDAELEVGLGGRCHDLAEHFRELGGVLRLFVSGLFPVEPDFRIALAESDAGHGEVHADLGALALEVGAESFDDFGGNAFDDADLMLGGPVQVFLDDFLELLARGLAEGTFFGADIALDDLAADGASPFFHGVIPPDTVDD